jgi:PHD/YefM family antitoxin component YafN of YafNO toxin-antitoxin module
MEAVKVGMREFRDKLATYLLESDTPVAITRHGDTVGYFIPARRRRSEADKAALKEAAARWHEILEAEGISEDDVAADFAQWRSIQKR